MRPKQIPSLGIFTTFLVTIGAALLSSALAQQGFDNASLRGTYSFVFIAAAPGAPIPDVTSAGLIYFPGDGTNRGVGRIANSPGEPDAEGNPTRNVIRNVQDPSTAFHWTGPAEVFSDGTYFFAITDPITSEFDGVVTRAEMIDGQLTIVESVHFLRVPAGPDGGLGEVRLTRIADSDILPQPGE